jgi:hypothetical protein
MHDFVCLLILSMILCFFNSKALKCTETGYDTFIPTATVGTKFTEITVDGRTYVRAHTPESSLLSVQNYGGSNLSYLTSASPQHYTDYSTYC